MSPEQMYEQQMRAIATQAAIAYYCCGRCGDGDGAPGGTAGPGSAELDPEFLDFLEPLIQQFFELFLG